MTDMQNSLCRFCFNESTQEMQELSENSQIFIKLTTSVRIVIKPLEEPLPKRICNKCTDRINEIHQFHQKITESEALLMQYKNKGKGELKKLYFSLQNKVKIKIDTNTCLDNKENENIGNIKMEDVLNTSENDDNIYDDSNLETVKFESEDNLKNMPQNQKAINENTSQSVFVDKDNEQSVVLSNSQFKCLTCFELFDSHSSLLHHYNTEHYQKTNTEIVENHYEIVTSSNGSSLFKCKECNKEYNNKRSIVRHNLLTHTNERPFICKLCGRTYKTASEIIRHSRAHNGTRLFCSYQCGYSTVYLGALKEHERRHNKAELKYKCEKCDKGFQVKTWFEQHQNVHTGLKPFVCDICGVAFHMDRYLTAHRSTVHPQSSTMKRYVCVHCSLPYDSRKALTLHLKVHGINTNFLCDLCGKTLSDGKQLKFHKRMHLGVKPFSCSTCNKSFTKKFNLQLHERTHTGEKSHACLLCGKHYSQRSTLRRHNTRHHSNLDQLKCVKCIKMFTSYNQLAAHKKLCI